MSQNQLPVPKQLLEAIRTKNCVLYAGAGFSLESKLPDGSRLPTGAGLGFRLAQELYQAGHLATEPTADQQFDFAGLAEDYETVFGRQQLIVLLNEIYAADGLMAAEAHHQAIQFFPTIVTTNYDSLFEQAAYIQGRRPVVIRRESQVAFAGTHKRPTIIKIHGDFDDPETIIVTNTDYRNHPLPDGLREKLHSIFSEKTVLFIGCGLADSDLQEVYFTVLERLGNLKPRAFVVTPFPTENSPERKQWELSRKRWEQREMQFLPGKAGEFLHLLENALAEKKTEYDDSIVVAPSAIDTEKLIDEYRANLEKRVSTIRIFGEDEPRPLTKIFVELDVIEEYHRPEFDAEYLGLMDSQMRRRRQLFLQDEGFRRREDSEKAKRTIKSDELLHDEMQAVITGAPGSGKTTLLHYLAYRILQEEKRLPVFLELKTVTARDLKNAGYQLADLLFEKAVAVLIPLHLSQRELLKEAFLAKLASGEVAVLLDGLDEISGKDISPALFKSVNDFISRFKNNTLIISTRPYALQGRFDDLKEMEIAPLNQQQINQLIEHYYPDDAMALMQNLRARNDLRDMTGVPFLLSVIIGLHLNKKKLIESRLELYREIVVQLANKLDKEKVLLQPRFHIVDMEGALKLDFLKFLSCERLLIDEVKTQSAEKETARLVFTGDELLKKAKQFVKQENLTGVSPHLLVVDVKATSLLREVGADIYAFVHLTIMEYLAASALAEREDAKKTFCRAYFNTTLVEMEVLPMTLGLVNDADAFFTAIEQLPESLTYTGLRLRARGLRYGVQYKQQHQNILADTLVEFIKGERVEDTPYTDVIINSFLAKGSPFTALITARIKTLLNDSNSSVRENAVDALREIGGEQAVGGLLQALNNRGNSVRWRIVEALGEIGGEQAVAGLLQALSHEDSYVRWRAAEALGEIGGEQAIAGLLQALNSQYSDVRERVAQILGKIGGKQAVAKLLQALSSQYNSVRERAAQILGEIGGKQAVAKLLQALKDANSSVRARAVEALRKIGGEQAVGGLLQALNDEDSDIRWRAAEALGEIGGEQAVGGLLQALSHEDSYVRWRAAEALGKIGGEQAVTGLLQALNSQYSYVRWRAEEALRKIGGKQAIAGLLQALNSQYSDVRERVVEALGRIGGEQAVAKLLQALKDANSSVRARAVEALRKIGGEQAVGGLLQALNDEDSDIRWRAAEALGEIGGEQAVAGLLQALNDEDSDIRVRAAEALGKIGGEQAVTGLLQALNSQYRDVRERAAKALGGIGGNQGVTGLLQALNSQYRDVRESVVETLGKIGGEQAVAGLLQALGDEDSDIRWRAAEALRKIGGEQAVGGLLQALSDEDSDVRESAAQSLREGSGEHVVNRLLRALNHEDIDERENAVETLGKIGGEQAVGGLLQALNDEDSDIRVRAAEALRKIGGEQAVTGLLQALNSQYRDVRERAAEALRKIGGEQAIAGLLQALSHDDSDVRESAAEALGEIGGEQAIAGLLQALSDEDSDVRERAAEALGEIGGKQAVAGLLQALNSQYRDVRERAAEALGEIGGEQAVAGLLQALSDEDSYVRWRAAEALGGIGGEQAVAGLLQALSDEDSYVRWRAAEALGGIGGEQAVAGLLQALNSQYSDVRERAAKALGEIGGEQGVTGLLQALSHNDKYVRWSAVSALSKVGGEQAVAGLLQALKDEDRNVRRRATDALVQMGGEQAIAGLLQALSDEDDGVRGSAASVLVQVGSEQVVARLLQALSDGDDGVSGSAASVLFQVGSEQVVAGLLQALNHNDKYVRRSAVSALIQVGSKQAIAGLLQALKDGDRNVRWSAAEGLTKFNDEALSAGFIYALSGSSDFVRQKGAQNVGYYYKYPQLLEALTHLVANDLIEEVRSAASLAREAFIHKLQLFNKETHALDAARKIEREVTVEDNRNFIAQEVANTIAPLQEMVANLTKTLQRTTLDREHLVQLSEQLQQQTAEVLAMPNRFDDSTRQLQMDEELEVQIQIKYEEVKTANNSQAKGKILEELAALLFSSVAGFIHDGQNDRTSTEEIDVIIRNESLDPFWQRQGDLILIECKNWQAASPGKKSKRVGKNEYVAFERKLKTRFGRCKLGIIVCAEGFASTIKQKMKTSSKEDALVVLINGDDLLALVESNDRNTLLKQWVKRATLV